MAIRYQMITVAPGKLNGGYRLSVYLFTLCLLFSTQRAESQTPEISIGNLSSLQGEISVRNWQLLGPFYTTYASATPPFEVDHFVPYSTTETAITEAAFFKIGEHDSSIYNKDTVTVRNFSCHPVQGFPMALHQLFRTKTMANAYAACVINSPTDQDIAFLSGIDDGVKIWVNNKLCLAQNGYDMHRNARITAVHLKKGRNFVMFKITNGWGEWEFYVNISSYRYAQQVYLNKKHSDFIMNPVMKDKEPLSIEAPDSAFVKINTSATLEIFDAANEKVGKKNTATGMIGNIPLSLKEGAYKCRLIAGNDTLEQKFTCGNYQDIFNRINAQIKPLCTTGKQKINVETLLRRFIYLDSFGIRNTYDRPLYRKIAIVLYELESVFVTLQKQKEPFAHVPGWHLRGYVSGIDDHVEKYMLYVPDSYKKDVPVPLVVIQPWASGKVMPFAESMHVADIEYIELIARLARKNGYAVLWTSSRIYTIPSLNPLFNTATFEAIEEVKQDYNIDTQRLYGYGSCGGGLLTLVMANRYPSLFAAVGVEGPGIGYTLGDKIDNGYPPEWVKANSILHHVQNYVQTPLYIIHSKNDTRAGYFGLSKQLVAEVNTIGGSATLDSADNVTKTLWVNMYSQDEMMTRFFSFFKDKKREPPLAVRFATSQLKYNRAHWLTIDQMDLPGKATIDAGIKKGNRIEVVATHVKAFSIDVPQLPGIKRTEKLKITANGQVGYDDFPTDKKITIKLNMASTDPVRMKTHDMEGPVNDFFKSGFMVVQGTASGDYYNKVNESGVKAFVKSWSDNFYGMCRLKKDSEIDSSDIHNYNLVLVGTPHTNKILKQIMDKLPLKINSQSIVLNGQNYQGSNLRYTIIYPNPLNPGKYVLLLGSNNPEKAVPETDHFYKGWFDYQVYNISTGQYLTQGFFDNQWK